MDATDEQISWVLSERMPGMYHGTGDIFASALLAAVMNELELTKAEMCIRDRESANKDVARRILDFLSGVAYANDGQIKKVANCTFIITPYNVGIMGDLLDELENNGDVYKRQDPTAQGNRC